VIEDDSNEEAEEYDNEMENMEEYDNEEDVEYYDELN